MTDLRAFDAWARYLGYPAEGREEQVIAQFRRVLAVIGYAVQFCPVCGNKRGEIFFCARDPWVRAQADEVGREIEMVKL